MHMNLLGFVTMMILALDAKISDRPSNRGKLKTN